MWLTPAWQAAIAVFGSIFTAVVLPVMLDAKIPSANCTIPQYTRDAMLMYWLTKVEPFRTSMNEVITDIPTTANFQPITSSGISANTTAHDADSFEAAKVNVSEPFVDPTAPEADSFETAELPGDWFGHLLQPSLYKEHHPFVLQLMHDTSAWLGVLPALGVCFIIFATLSCIWFRWKAPKTERAASIHLDLIQALQKAASSATPSIAPVLLVVLDAASSDQKSLDKDAAALNPQLDGPPQPLSYEQGRTRFVKYRNVKAAKAQARRRKAVATLHRAAGRRASEAVVAKLVLEDSKALSTAQISNLLEITTKIDCYKQQCGSKLLDVTTQVEDYEKQSDFNLLDTTARFNDHKQQCESNLEKGLVSAERKAKDFFDRSCKAIPKLKERTTSTAADLEDKFEERCRFIDDRIDLEDTEMEIKKLWKAQDEAIGTIRRLHECLDTTTLVLGDMGEKLKNFDAHIMESNDVETSVDVKLCSFKDNIIQPQLNSYKNEADTAIKAVAKQSVESATAVQERLVNLEESCKDLITDKPSKNIRIAKLQDDQKDTSLKIREQSIVIKILNKKLQDEVQNRVDLQTKLQVFFDKTDCCQQNVEGLLNQPKVDVADEIKKIKLLIGHAETTLGKSLQDLQGTVTDVENRTGAVEQDLKSLQVNVADVGNRTVVCEKGLNDLQGSVAGVQHCTGVCQKSLNGLSPLQEAFVKAEDKLDTVEKQVASIKTKDLPKIVNEQKVLRDRLNGVSAEVQRVTNTEPKNKRQRRRPRWEENPPLDGDDEDGAGPGSQGTSSPASLKSDSRTPASGGSTDSINDKSSKSPSTSPDSTGTSPKQQSDRVNDKSPDSPPTSPESNGTGPKQSLQPPASAPASPPKDTPMEDPEMADNESGKDVRDNKGPSEPRTPPSSSTEEPQVPVTKPKAAQNLIGDKYYDALGVQFDATPGQIKKAYKVRASLVHPDKNKNDPSASHEAFVFLGEAYRVLSDLKEKNAYDRARIDGTTYEPAPASDGFVPDTGPLPSATPPVDLEILRKVLEARISDRIWDLKKRPGAWKFSAMMLRPNALEELMKEDPDQPWPVC